MNFSFKNFLNPQALVGAINKLPLLRSQIMDLVYPPEKQINHPFDTVGYADLGPAAKNIPLVTRDGQSYSMQPGDSKLKYIEPANFTPSDFVSAADINRLRNLPQQSVQKFIEQRIDNLRRAVRKSKEALAIQSLTGKINYDLVKGIGFEKYEVLFGAIKSVTISTKWNATGASAAVIITDVGNMVAEIGESSDATKFIGLMDAATFAVVAGHFTSASLKNLPVQVGTNSIIIGNVEFYVTSAKYYDYSTKAFVPAIGAKKVKIVGVDDGFKFMNCALDSIDQNFAGIPFGVREIITDDPEGIKLIGMARPMPIPNVKAICEATVLT